MAHVSLYIATSLDGYIARSDGAIDWLSIVESEGEDYGYTAFYQSVDGIIMGSKTYEQVLTFGDWPYPGKKTFVFTRRKFNSDRAEVEFLSEGVDCALARIEAQGLKRIWLVGGGALVSSFQGRGLIDEYIISVLPVLLGEGIPLFLPSGRREDLALVSSSHYPSGLVQNHYRSRRSAERLP